MFPSLDFLLRKGIGSRIVVILGSFPFFMTGKLVGLDPGVVAIEAQEDIPIQLVGRTFYITQASIAAFFIEEKGFPPLTWSPRMMTVWKRANMIRTW